MATVGENCIIQLLSTVLSKELTDKPKKANRKLNPATPPPKKKKKKSHLFAVVSGLKALWTRSEHSFAC